MSNSDDNSSNEKDPEKAARMDALFARHAAAAHAIQSGVQMTINLHHKDSTAKHLRTGINLAMSDHSALARLLIAKGIITDEEYVTALAEAAEMEQARYEELISSELGKKVRLG